MILTLLIVFGILMASVYVGLSLQEDAGYVFIAIHHWTIETSLWVALLSVMSGMLLCYALLRIVWRLMHVAGYWQAWQGKKAILLANRMFLYQQQDNWQALIDLLPAIKKYKLYSMRGFEQMQKSIYEKFMQELIHNQQYEALEHWVDKHLPKDLKQAPNMVFYYAKALIGQQKEKRAEALIRKTLQHTIDDNLLRLYSTLNPRLIAIKNILSLLDKYQDSASIYLCLGSIYMNNQLWGKAKDCLRKSVALQASAPAYHALGLLSEQLGELDAALEAYRAGLGIITQLP